MCRQRHAYFRRLLGSCSPKYRTTGQSECAGACVREYCRDKCTHRFSSINDGRLQSRNARRMWRRRADAQHRAASPMTRDEMSSYGTAASSLVYHWYRHDMVHRHRYGGLLRAVIVSKHTNDDFRLIWATWSTFGADILFPEMKAWWAAHRSIIRFIWTCLEHLAARTLTSSSRTPYLFEMARNRLNDNAGKILTIGYASPLTTA